MTAVLSVGMDNDAKAGGFEFFPRLPEGMEATSASLAERANGFTLYSNKDGDVYK